ncbi:MAG: hypothetical protein WC592_00010 [Candidatus Omnitrophota bacterium]|nr:hypothetical protein [Candidatus Omnitrophota bacterium]
MRHIRLITLIVVLWTLIVISGTVFADVALKIVIANGSASEEKDVPVYYNLPAGVKKDDVVSADGLNVDYDAQKGLYFVKGSVKLKPMESSTIKVVIKDVWKVSPQDVEELSTILKDKMNSIKDEKVKEKLNLVEKSISSKIEAILKDQADYADDIEKRMQLFSAVNEKISAIKNDIFSLDTLVYAGGWKEEDAGAITLIIEAENPTDKKLTTPVKYYLPKEVIPDYVTDPAGFAIRYDAEKDLSFLEKEAAFEPKEKKRFAVKVKNVWRISEEVLKGFIDEASKMNEKLKSTELASLGASMYNDIKKKADGIIESQNKAETVIEHIANYRTNQKALDDIKESLSRMHRLFEERKKDEAIQKNRIKNVLREINILQQVKKMSDVLIKGKLQQVGVWKIVLIIVLFVIIITSSFYVIWFMRLQKEDKIELKKVDTGKSAENKK